MQTHSKSKLIFIPYFNRLNRNFYSRAKKISVLPEMEDIHQLRVCTKKIRSLFALSEIISAGNISPSNNLEMLSGIYSASGKIRSCQINLELMERYNNFDLNIYKDYLIFTEKLYTKSLSEILSGFNLSEYLSKNKKFRSQFRKYNDDDILIGVEKFIDDKLNDIINYDVNQHIQVIIHNGRKNLKNVSACLLMLNDYFNNENIGKLYKEIKSVEDITGNWNDTEQLRKSIKKFISKYDGIISFAGLNELILCVKCNNEAESENIIKLIIQTARKIKRNSTLKSLFVNYK